MSDESPLTPVDKLAIQGYMLKLVAAPLSLAFLAGFLVQRIAYKEAEFAALTRIEGVVAKLNDKAQDTSEKLRSASEKTSGINTQIRSLLTSHEQLSKQMDSYNNFIKNPDERLKALAALDEYPEAVKLLARLATIEERIAVFEIDGRRMQIKAHLIVEGLEVDNRNFTDGDSPRSDAWIKLEDNPRYGPSINIQDLRFGSTSVSAQGVATEKAQN